MKRRFRIHRLSLALVICSGVLLAGQLAAQTFTLLHTFSGTNDGANPAAGLVLSSNTFYGTTEGGGSQGSGTVFAVNTDGTGLAILHSFSGGVDGANPASALVLSGNILYGTTSGGGTSSNGMVFALNTDGTGFTNLYSFSAISGFLSTNSDGASPQDGLVLTGNTLYGTASAGGTAGNGTLFAINIDGTGFRTLHSFMATVSPQFSNSDGAIPNGLIVSSNTLYGTTASGGGLGGGTVFAINVDGTGFTNLHGFPHVDILGGILANSDGSIPKGLTLSGNALYGTAKYGGATGDGTVFKVNTDGTGFANLHSFTPFGYPPEAFNDGAYPSGGLVISGDVIYGTASGTFPPSSIVLLATTNHTVFRVNTDGTGFATLHDFAKPSGNPAINADGIHVYGGLILSSNTVYGAAFEGGSLGKGTLFSLSEFAYVTNNGTITITGYVGPGQVTIPSQMDGLPVTSIGSNAFSGFTSLTDVVIPSSVTSIGPSAFNGCTRLTNVTLPNSITSIGDAAFESCSSLSSIALPSSLTTIGNSAFQGCTALAYLALPNGVSTIGDLAFQSCSGLTNVTIPSSVVSIGSDVFGYCTNLTQFTVDALNPVYSSIDGVLFSKSGSMLIECPPSETGSYTIPYGVTDIDDNAFASCAGLTNVIIPNSVNNIGNAAFQSCSGLTSLTIPISVTSIGSFAFSWCTSLTKINVPNSVTNIGDQAFRSCSSLTSFVVPNSITSIGFNVFSACFSLTNVTIPDSVTSIGNDAFYECGLVNLTLPASIAAIGNGAFTLCGNLMAVYFEGNAPSQDGTAFVGDTNLVYYLPGTGGWVSSDSSYAGRPAVLWLPRIQINDSSFGVQNNSFGFNISWASGMSVVVEACRDLANPNWIPIQTNTLLLSGSRYFIDPGWTNYVSRFYRLRYPPLPSSEPNFNTLYSFTGGWDGGSPYGGVVLSGDTLYGTTAKDGASGFGTVFTMNTDGTGFTNVHTFSGVDGGSPYAGVLLSANTLFGTTSAGSNSLNGNVFSVNTDGSGFTNLYSFAAPQTGAATNSDGYAPVAGLAESGNTLYGTAALGGSWDDGTLFRVNADGTGFQTLYNFSGPTNSMQQAGVILSGNKLYGAATYGGSSNCGMVFGINTDGSGFTSLYRFSGSDGCNPYASLILPIMIYSSNTLYGTTAGGGTSNLGTVFAIQTDGTGFALLHSFTGASDGANPVAGLVQGGNTLYGVAANQGRWGGGTMFSINMDGTGFTNLHDFSPGYSSSPFKGEGYQPRGTLILSGNTLYGTTLLGGQAGYGTVFSLALPP